MAVGLSCLAVATAVPAMAHAAASPADAATGTWIDSDYRIDPPATPMAATAIPRESLPDSASLSPRIAGPTRPFIGPVPPDAAPTPRDPRYDSFRAQVGAVKWEAGALFAYMTVTQIIVTKETESFHFQDEGWFGKSTTNLGVDKLTHAYNSYLLAELFNARIARKSGDRPGAAVASAALAMGLMAYSELYDAHKVSSGWSMQDTIANATGAAFSVARNSIPGLKEKLDFRLLLVPNNDIYTLKGKRHYAQQRFMLALQLSGFDRLRQTPWRFAELHVGYHASGFTNRDRELGREPRRRIFYGVGVNLKELFWPTGPRSTWGRIGHSALDYLQVPYTAAHFE